MKHRATGFLLAAAMAMIAAVSRPATGGVPPHGAFDYTAGIGVVYLDDANQPHLEIRSKGLEPGTRITFVNFGAIGNDRLVELEIGRRLSAGPNTSGTGEIPLAAANYELIGGPVDGDALGIAGLRMPIGIGIVARADRCRVARYIEVFCDLEPDGVEVSFRWCTSVEAVHYTVWSGAPLEGEKRWYGYFPLGFETVPNCTEKDYTD